MFRIPKIHFRNSPFSYLDVGLSYNFTRKHYNKLYTRHTIDDLTIDGASVHKRTVLSSLNWFRDQKMGDQIPSLCNQRHPPSTRHRPSHRPWFSLHRWDCLRYFLPLTWVLPQGPLNGPWGFFPRRFQPKDVHLRLYNLPHQFHRKRTVKTQRNLPRHTRSLQGKTYEYHGRAWTFDLKNSLNLTHVL